VIRNATANPLEVADGVRAVLPLIQRDLPPSVKVHPGQRQLGLHRPLDQGGVLHGGRSGGAGGAGGVRLPAHAARVDHPAGDDSRSA
jgi:hypothetical protein